MSISSSVFAECARYLERRLGKPGNGGRVERPTLEVFNLVGPYGMLTDMLGQIFNFKMKFIQGIWSKSMSFQNENAVHVKTLIKIHHWNFFFF